MNVWWILAFAYLAIGLGTTLLLISASNKKGEPSVFLIFGNSLQGLLAWVFLWPILSVVAGVELNFPKEQINEPKQKQTPIEMGIQGVTQTKMRPSGKIKIENNQLDAYSLSGSLEAGERVEIVSKEMNVYKVRKVKQTP